MAKITKSTTIGEALKLNPNAEVILQGFGMHCVHCPMSQMETLEEAGAVHLPFETAGGGYPRWHCIRRLHPPDTSPRGSPPYSNIL